MKLKTQINITIIIVFLIYAAYRYFSANPSQRGQVGVELCTEGKDQRNPYGCGFYGQCWAWCHHVGKLASNMSESSGKWCFTTEDSAYDVFNRCWRRAGCAEFKVCKGICSAECFKGNYKIDESWRTVSYASGKQEKKQIKKKKKKPKDKKSTTTSGSDSL